MRLDTPQVTLYYETAGTGRPLILLHGNGEDHTIFNVAVSVLVDHFTVYAVDSRGHGQSSPVPELHYTDMAEDIYALITQLGLEKPMVYGFSDGGILALLLAIHHPETVSGIIASGVNTQPNGLLTGQLLLFRLMYLFNRSPLLKLMLTEPDISDEQLRQISVPVAVTGGSSDMIRAAHLRHIAEQIPQGTLTIFPGEDHGSYIINSTKIADFIVETCEKEFGQEKGKYPSTKGDLDG